MYAVNTKPAPAGFVVIVWFDVVAGNERAFRAAMLENASASLTEPGCRQFDVCFAAAGEGDEALRRCFLYEVYDDADAFEAHKRTPHFMAFDAVSRPWVAAKRVETWGLAQGSGPSRPRGAR